MGSVAFTALARCNWVVLAEQDDDERPTGRLLFARSKQNIGEPAGAMAYRIRSAVVDADRGISAPAIDWEGCIEGSADTLVARPRRKGESVKLTEAVSFLTELMEDGSVRASAVEDERHKRGIADKTLRRAKQVLGIQSEQRDDGWYWVFGVDPIDNGAAGQLGSTERENGETPAL
jgi:putative DNA primase/helicase